MSNYRNQPWFISTNTTAAGIALEYTGGKSSATTAAALGAQPPRYRLRGFSVSGSTAVAISTTPIKIIWGHSSLSPLSTSEVCNDPGVNPFVVTDLMGIEGGYLALETTVAHADGGLTFAMWGD
jgi:hypothetical protein